MNIKQFAAMLLLALCCATQAGAQSFLDNLRKEKQGEGTVTVTQSKDIDELVNNAKLVRSTPAAPQHDKTQSRQGSTNAATHKKPDNDRDSSAVTHDANKARSSAHEPHKEPSREQRNTPKEPDMAEDTTPVNTAKKVLRGSRKVTGYRIQAFTGGNSRADRQKAENIGTAIKMKFPEQPIYVHFYSPRWICRVGNFRTYQEASNMLREIKSMGYRQACIVKGKIDVAY